MTSTMNDIPILFMNGAQQDNQAYQMICKAGIECEFHGPTLDISTPCVLYKRQKYFGLKEISDFLCKMCENSV